jgi:hypothetical protein
MSGMKGEHGREVVAGFGVHGGRGGSDILLWIKVNNTR